jgi:hypothetical protein
LKEFTRETLLAQESACHHYFDPQVLREIVDRHEAETGLQQEIWTMLVFEQWHSAFVQAKQPSEPKSVLAQMGEPH